jgi:hypothetical protein
MSVTGFAFDNLPDSPERDKIIGMCRIVTAWRANQCGRRPGAVHHYLCDVADSLGNNLTFDALVLELRFRLLRGHDADLILDDVDIGAETVTWCEAGKDCHAMPFSTLANKWSKVRKLKMRET